MALALVGLAVGGGFWLEWERGERRAEAVRQEEREARAVEAALEQASALGRQGRWPDARAVLEGAASQLSSSAPANLRERLMQARSDANMAAKLEGIRLRLSTDSTKTRGTAAPLYAEYAEAFRNYFSIDLLILEPEAAARRVGNSAIRETLLAYLHDWHYWAMDADRAKLRAVLDRADDDPWRRAWREAVAVRDTTVPRDIRRMVVLAAKTEALAQPPLVLSGLGGVLLWDGHREETLAFLREAQQRHPEDFWLNYLLGRYWEKERPQVAVGYFRAAVAIRPRNDEIHTRLGRALLKTGDAEGAIAAFRKALELNPNADVARDLAKLLAPQDRLEEVRAAWEKHLERDPPDHDSWYGFAELCLFLGREEDYRRARQALLKRFSATTNPFEGERTARACLLLPGTDDELRQAVALAERTVADLEGDKKPWHPYFDFAHGLAEYRQGQFDRAIATMEGDASGVLGPAPRLVLALSLHRSGQVMEARKTLAAAILAHDWRAMQVHALDQQNGWIYHILRREAEALILPKLQAFRQGDWQPEDNDERLALLGICESEALYGTASRLCADAFAADPDLAERLTPQCLRRAAQESDKSNRTKALISEIRYRAARCAALAGCGLGKDSAKLSAAEQTHWRRKALEWLRTDLVVLSKTLDSGLRADRDIAKEMLTLWQGEPCPG